MDDLLQNRHIRFLTLSQSFKERLDPRNGTDFLPLEILFCIFDYMKPFELLKLSSTCYNWNLIIKQPLLWRKKYVRKYKEKPLQYPWFVLFSMVTTDLYNRNLIVSGSAEEGFRNWRASSSPQITYPTHGFKIILNTSIPNVPVPKGASELENIACCYTTTNIYCCKHQSIDFGANKLFISIVNAYRPIIYVAEWSSCVLITDSCKYSMVVELINNGRLANYCSRYSVERSIASLEESQWKKMEIELKDYAEFDQIRFTHSIIINRDMYIEEGLTTMRVTGTQLKIMSYSLPTVRELNCEDEDDQN